MREKYLVPTVSRMARAALPLALITRDAPTPSVVGAMQKMASLWSIVDTEYHRFALLATMARYLWSSRHHSWTYQYTAHPVANSGGEKGRLRAAKAITGVMPSIDTNPKAVPSIVRRVKADLSSSVRRVSPDMKNTVQMFMKLTTCTPATCTHTMPAIDRSKPELYILVYREIDSQVCVTHRWFRNSFPWNGIG
jgi:hypothetical protein